MRKEERKNENEREWTTHKTMNVLPLVLFVCVCVHLYYFVLSFNNCWPLQGQSGFAFSCVSCWIRVLSSKCIKNPIWTLLRRTITTKRQFEPTFLFPNTCHHLCVNVFCIKMGMCICWYWIIIAATERFNLTQHSRSYDRCDWG